MLMHYMFDENPGTHGLKTLAMKHTPFGEIMKNHWKIGLLSTGVNMVY